MSEVTVRMYRQGLGDCFLLAFPRPRDTPFYVLIDCGVIKGTENPTERTQAVAEDIAKTTKNHLHVLVATHEHWDHLSGFLQAGSVFQEMQVDTVWLAWTEDSSDALANALRQHRTDRVKALQAAVTRMAAEDSQRRDTGLAPVHGQTSKQVESLLGFFGDAPGEAAAAPDDKSLAGGTTEAALQSIRSGKGGAARPVRYCHPGEPAIDLLGDGSVRVYVLGPPHDSVLIHQSDPTKAGQEVYALNPHLTQETALLIAAEHGAADLAGLDGDIADCLNRSFPFDKSLHISKPEARTGLFAEFFSEHYGLENSEDKNGQDEEWRRVDTDWLEATGALALQLDSDTNNTSLALAFELGGQGTGKVLLFPADAQVGNWLSWQQYQWPPVAAAGQTPVVAGQTPVTAKDLLGRTVLYKVGHHGSHNATLRALGLELMTSPDLVAMIPVSQSMAEKKKWAMPFDPLYAALRQKTQQRIMRVDDGWEGDGWQNGRQGSGQPSTPWSRSENNPLWTDLYIEYTVTF